ncbi:SDR family oxidoreductase [Brachybacterium tyrofermentans]|uniref:SDR family oxidoreductase n=1 Tax=Brachybacterium tyrofermentans TaxID=47848 RepID=UPI003FCF1250
MFDEETKRAFEALIPRGETGRPEEIAAAGLFLASDDSSYVDGMELAVEGKEEVARIRMERLVAQSEEIEEQIQRLDAVIALIRRDLGEDADDGAAPRNPQGARRMNGPPHPNAPTGRRPESRRPTGLTASLRRRRPTLSIRATILISSSRSACD